MARACLLEDLEQVRMIPEFVGRIPVVTLLNELSEEDLVRIPHRAEERSGEAVHQDVRVRGFHADVQEALKAIAHEAVEHGYEARGLRSICW